VLCLNISEVLDTVSFPGEHLSYLEVAKRVIIGCTVWELAEAIREMGLNPCQRVYYKVQTDLVSVERAEEILLGMLTDGDYVLANEFLDKLGIPAKSATYTELKKELASRGWKWKNKKVNRKVLKAIYR
jgi:ABC-type transport system involved in Fe-S cluster assembly fused permease/ATPase subunit